MFTVLPILRYLLSFFLIWFGAGIIIRSIDKISKKLRIRSFIVAFFILGLLTSIPETAIGINAVIDGSPEIFVGTLLGGSVVLFLLIIPLLALIGKGIKIQHDLSKNNLIFLLATIALPSLLVIDHKVTNIEGLILIFAYLINIYLVQKQVGWLKTTEKEVLTQKAYTFVDLVKVAVGVGLVIVSSQNIVLQTIEFSKILEIPAFYISLLVLSVGTNLPELSLAIRSVLSGKKDIAFGDYLGSAAANSLLFGIFTLANNGEVFTFNSFYLTLIFLTVGLIMFFLFSRSQHMITRKEGAIMFSVYVLFIILETLRITE